MPDAGAGGTQSSSGRRRAALVVVLCGTAALLALSVSLDVARYLLALASSRLANPPRTGLLWVICAALAATAPVFAAVAWRVWRDGTPHRRETIQASAPVLLLWVLAGGFLLGVNYPVPVQAHHTGKFLGATLVVAALAVWFLVHPAGAGAWLGGRLFHWATVVLTNALVFVGVAELTLRASDPLLARSGLFGDKQTPANLRPHSPVRGSIGVTNSQGFRDLERAVERTGPGPRVVALGDSMTWGSGVSYDEAFVTLVERGFQSAWPGAEVLNLGVPAWGPHEEFHLLQAYGVRFAPDLVMLNFFVGNDIQNKRGEDASLPRILVVAGQSYYVHSNGNWMHDMLGPDRWYLYHNLNYLIRVGGSRVFRMARGRTGEMQGEYAPLVSHAHYLKGIHERSDIYLKEDTALFGQHWTRTREILLAMRDYLRDRGIPLLVVMIPDQIQLDRALQNEYLAWFQLSPDRYDFEKPQRLFRAWLAQEGIGYLDLLPAFLEQAEPGSLYFENDFHWTVQGHALAAVTILPRLLEWAGDRPGLRPGEARSR